MKKNRISLNYIEEVDVLVVTVYKWSTILRKYVFMKNVYESERDFDTILSQVRYNTIEVIK